MTLETNTARRIFLAPHPRTIREIFHPSNLGRLQRLGDLVIHEESIVDEFLERRFPESRRKAYYLMSIHKQLPREVKRDLKQVGWTKGVELAKLKRKQGQAFESATWMHKARQMPKEQFKREVELELTGKDSEPAELIYFKVYRSQVTVIEQAIETAALMLGSDKSRGYCLEMICTDFLAGTQLDGIDPNALLNSLTRYYQFLPNSQREAFLSSSIGGFCEQNSP